MMPRSRFDEQLSALNNELIQLGAMCEEIIASAVKALTSDGSDRMEKISLLHEEIDRAERSVEALCLKLLLQQQPVAGDLRVISAALKMVTDLERIGDQAADIGEIVSFLDRKPGEDCADISSMAEAAVRMVIDSIDAYVKKDVPAAHSVMEKDDVVDEYFLKVKASLIDMIAEKPSDGGYALDLLMIAKYFERIGDHAVNIAEWVAFSVTGTHEGGTA